MAEHYNIQDYGNQVEKAFEKVPKDLNWLPRNTIFVVLSGSRAYGTSTADSDLDVKGIVVPPSSYRTGFLRSFEQAELKAEKSDRCPALEGTVYEWRKWFKLAAACNPNIIEMLWSERVWTPGTGSDRWGESDLGWGHYDALRYLLHRRDLFLSRRAKHTFSGYAMSQLKRIETHRKWLLNPPKSAPTREDFGLPKKEIFTREERLEVEAAIKKKLDMWNIDFDEVPDGASKLALKERLTETLSEMRLASDEDRYVAAARSLGVQDLEHIRAERQYADAKRNFDQFLEWQRNRNPARAAMEAQYGYDTKHAMHLVRLMTMAREILQEKKVIVRRPDAEFLLSIRNGAWPYDQLIEWARRQDGELEEAEKHSTLPRSPNMEELDSMCQMVHNLVTSSHLVIANHKGW